VKILDRVLNPREIRRRLGMNQEQFWTQIGVTQSGGSRYESGREMPRPVKELLRLVHVEQLDLSQVKRVDFEIISYLKESHPDLYRTLRRAVRSRHRAASQDAGVNLNMDASADGGYTDPDDLTTQAPALTPTRS
jgi:transcriptional regulator with XRE-family HTH domain